MRGRSLVAILGAAGVFALVAALAVWLAAGSQTQTATTIVDIPDNPAALAATEAQEAEVIASLPSAADETPAAEEVVAEEPGLPEKLFIADTIRAQAGRSGATEGRPCGRSRSGRGVLRQP